ncbi:MAG: hypothetical protein M3O62_15490 [Pseudomonadota bacterium]|nr:hypothetical protein [Pseudomonadota bacterium]
MPVSANLARHLLPAAALLLGACESNLAVDLSVSLPSQLASAKIAVKSIELLDDDGGVTSIDVDNSDMIDLADYPPDAPLRLFDASGELSGHFIGIRLRFDDSDAYVLADDGETAPIALLSAGEYADIDVQIDEGSYALIGVQLDLPFSLIDQRDSLANYQMIPVSHAADGDSAASIEGTIAADAVTASTCRDGRAAGEGVAVYLFSGSDVTPADYYSSGSVGSQDPPVGYAGVSRDSATGEWRYLFAPLAPGDYTLAWTCAADGDSPVLDDDLEFVASQNITVEALAAATAGF